MQPNKTANKVSRLNHDFGESFDRKRAALQGMSAPANTESVMNVGAVVSASELEIKPVAAPEPGAVQETEEKKSAVTKGGLHRHSAGVDTTCESSSVETDENATAGKKIEKFRF